LGVRPLDLADWIEYGPDADAAIAAKERLNLEHRDTVFAVLDDAEAESREVAAAIVDHLHEHWPDRYGTAGLAPDLHPLDAAARLVPDDLVLMVERDGGLVFGGGSVCFPNRWDLRSKLGLTMAGVHAPVAQLNEQLEQPIDAFFARLTPERSFWRLGWGVVETDDLYLPIDGTAAPRPEHRSPESMFLRVERESIRRFPQSNCVLFTIRTYVASVVDMARQSEVADRFADALAALPGDVRDYKGLGGSADDLVALMRRSVPQT